MLIVFEGCSKVGKSTTIEHLRARLQAQGARPVALCHPGELDRMMRSWIQHARPPLDPVERLLVYGARLASNAAAARAALDADPRCVAMLDRYTVSLEVLSHDVDGAALGPVSQVAKIAGRELQPDLWVFLDAPFETHQARNGSEPKERYERFRAGFLRAFESISAPKVAIRTDRMDTESASARILERLRAQS